MSIRINEHTRSVQRNLTKAVNEVQDAHRSLGSGKRINRAGDDLAGAAQIERFTSQVRGYSRAARNAYDGIGLARQAERSIDSAVGVMHHMKELAIQAANETNNAEDRLILQDGMQAMMGELERIGSTSDFVGIKLLDGSFMQEFIHLGVTPGDGVGVTIRDARPSFLGRYAVMSTARMDHDALERNEVLINGITIRTTVEADDHFSSTLRRASAVAKAAAINDFSRFTGVSAHLQMNHRDGVSDIRGGDLVGDNFFEINGVAIGGFAVEASDVDQVLLNAINRLTHRTGVHARVNDRGAIKLSAEDGRNIEVRTGGDAHEITGLRLGSGADVTTGQLTLVSEDYFEIDDVGEQGFESRIGAVDNAKIGVNQEQTISTIDVSTREGANLAIKVVGRALEQLSMERSRLGGLENRLEFTIQRVNTAAQGAYRARGVIRDADFAHESAKLARGQIMQQAFTNVLAQANAASQSALSLI